MNDLDPDSAPQTWPHEFEPETHRPERCAVRFNGTWVQCGHPRAQHRWPCSPTCTHDDAWNPGHPERVKERSEAVSDAATRHYVSRDLSDEQERALDRLLDDARDNGAEAMRAACWEAVQPLLQRLGFTADQRMWAEFKTAIEGATP